MIISPKQLIRMTKKGRMVASFGRRSRIPLPKPKEKDETSDHMSCRRSSSSVAKKGHFVIYTSDQKRLEIPLLYLKDNIFRGLLKMSEDEFGVPRDGPITLPCDAVFLKNLVSLIQRGVSRNMEEALLVAINTSWC